MAALTLLLFSLVASSSPLLASSARCNPTDKKVLIQLKHDLGDPYDLIAWNTPGAGGCCDWAGVTCDETTARVTGLDFAATKTDTIPDTVANFPFLTSLTFHKCSNLTKPIPAAIAKITKLTFLRLDWNSLTGPVPSFLARLTSLDYLNLSFNRLSGAIPAAIANLPLSYINLSRNRLTGTIPPALAASSSTYLYLSHNNLTGALPATFSAAAFEVIDLSRNQLVGDASQLFGKSKPLQFVDLSRNQFDFDLTSVEFSLNVTRLDLNHNKIYGSIPRIVAKLQLQLLNVSYNQLCGKIPSGGSIARFTEYEFFHNKCLCGAPLAACNSASNLRRALGGAVC